MFDTMTLNELYTLHRQLGNEASALHATVMDGTTPLVSVFGDRWRLVIAKCGEISETMDAVYAETIRREQEPADA